MATDIKRLPLFGHCPDLTPEEIKEMDDDIKNEIREQRLADRCRALSRKRKLTAAERHELDEIRQETE